MANNVKNLIDNIINDTKGATPTDVPTPMTKQPYDSSNACNFDKGAFKEKLSMFVLKDMIHAMMHDDINDLDEMIDSSIMKHIHDDYKGTCYGYLANARDDCKSPMIQDIVQEIDDTADKVDDKIKEDKFDNVSSKIDVKELLKDVENYDELRQRIEDKVANKVVDDVASVITKDNNVPTFDNVDEELNKISDETTSESMILKMTGNIVMEHFVETSEKLDTETAMNKAIVEYCINEMDMLFKQYDLVNSFHAKYHQ